MSNRRSRVEVRYDACLSFAGENRRIVQPIAKRLAVEGIRVFYDEYEKADLWGKDLYSHLDEVYGRAARYCVLFISKHYAKKLWANHERRSALKQSCPPSEIWDNKSGVPLQRIGVAARAYGAAAPSPPKNFPFHGARYRPR